MFHHSQHNNRPINSFDSIILSIIIGRLIHLTPKKLARRILLITGIALNAGILIYYKYADFILSFTKENAADVQKEVLLPLGLSFFTFKAISYLVDVYSGKAVLSENPVHDALYLSFFGQIQSGPLSRYNDMCFPAELDGKKNARMNLFSDGVLRFLIGFNKKVLLANILAKVTTEVFSTPVEKYTMAYAWLGSICFSLQLFFDFAGYSDMAIGLSEMFGYKCRENFNYPYMTESVAKFWRRWHISLSEWFRDYIYIPLGGSRNKNKWRVYFNLLVVWVLTGIWHGAAWTFVFWGLGYFVLISFERLTKLPDRLQSKPSKIIYRVFTLLFINCQWILFRSDTLKNGIRFIKRLFVFYDNKITDFRALFLLKEYGVFIAAAILLCFPVVPWLRKKLEGRTKALVVFDGIVYTVILGLFVCALSFVVAGQNNPFAYANF